MKQREARLHALPLFRSPTSRRNAKVEAYQGRLHPGFFGYNAALELQYRVASSVITSSRAPALQRPPGRLPTAEDADRTWRKIEFTSIGCSIKWKRPELAPPVAPKSNDPLTA